MGSSSNDGSNNGGDHLGSTKHFRTVHLMESAEYYSRSWECPFSPIHLVGYLIILSHNIFPLEPSLCPHFSKSLCLDFRVIHYCPRPAWLNFSPTDFQYLLILKYHQHDAVMSFPREPSSLLPSPLSPCRA